jgi:hypothetical protein
MKLRDRLERAEESVDRPRFSGCDPTVIRVFGGIDAGEPARATIGAITIERERHDTLGEFEDRAVDLAIERGVAFIVVGGLPTLDSDGSPACSGFC